MEYDNTNRGVLFKQEDKPKENAPDYKGTFNRKGEDFRIAGWLKISKAGKPYLSLVEDDFVPQQQTQQKPQQTQQSQDFSQDIPF